MGERQHARQRHTESLFFHGTFFFVPFGHIVFVHFKFPFQRHTFKYYYLLLRVCVFIFSNFISVLLCFIFLIHQQQCGMKILRCEWDVMDFFFKCYCCCYYYFSRVREINKKKQQRQIKIATIVLAVPKTTKRERKNNLSLHAIKIKFFL